MEITSRGRSKSSSRNLGATSSAFDGQGPNGGIILKPRKGSS